MPNCSSVIRALFKLPASPCARKGSAQAGTLSGTNSIWICLAPETRPYWVNRNREKKHDRSTAHHGRLRAIFRPQQTNLYSLAILEASAWLSPVRALQRKYTSQTVILVEQPAVPQLCDEY